MQQIMMALALGAGQGARGKLDPWALSMLKLLMPVALFT